MLDKSILIPAYIGYSSNEGSGIFDPIQNSKINYKFYKFTSDLNIDTEYLYKLIETNPNSVLLHVNYFGFRDKAIEEIKKYAKVKPIRNEAGLTVDFQIEWEFPCYGNDDYKVDTLAVKAVADFNDELKKLQEYLVEHSDAGNIIVGTGGLRKFRWRLPKKGKSGSIRTIFIEFATYEKTYLIGVYSKAMKETLTESEKKQLREFVKILLVELRGDNDEWIL